MIPKAKMWPAASMPFQKASQKLLTQLEKGGYDLQDKKLFIVKTLWNNYLKLRYLEQLLEVKAHETNTYGCGAQTSI